MAHASPREAVTEIRTSGALPLAQSSVASTDSSARLRLSLVEDSFPHLESMNRLGNHSPHRGSGCTSE